MILVSTVFGFCKLTVVFVFRWRVEQSLRVFRWLPVLVQSDAELASEIPGVQRLKGASRQTAA